MNILKRFAVIVLSLVPLAFAGCGSTSGSLLSKTCSVCRGASSPALPIQCAKCNNTGKTTSGVRFNWEKTWGATLGREWGVTSGKEDPLAEVRRQHDEEMRKLREMNKK